MATILVVGEQAGGHLKKATLAALSAAQQLAAKTGGQIAGLVIGGGAGQSAQELASYGIAVHVVEGAGFEHALAETHSAAAAEVAKKAGASDVVLAATAYGKDIAPRLAAKLGAGLASDVLGIAGVDKKHSEPTSIEKLENRYPVDAGRFHDDGLDAAFRKPVYQPMEIGRKGSEAAYWLRCAICPDGSHVYGRPNVNGGCVRVHH